MSFHDTEWLRGRLLERRASLARILAHKTAIGQDARPIRELIEANEADIVLVENGPKLSKAAETAVNTAFFAENGL